MKISISPSANFIGSILASRRGVLLDNRDVVARILEHVESYGDAALREYSKSLDGVSVDSFRLPVSEMAAAEKLLAPELKEAMRLAKSNIWAFHQSQQRDLPHVTISAGVSCWQEVRPIEKVGLYIPGGTAPLFSTLLMLAIPAQIAGCQRIVVCTPPRSTGNSIGQTVDPSADQPFDQPFAQSAAQSAAQINRVHPAVLYAAHLVGVNEIYTVGGAQAVAAMAYGTESIPKVDKIFGPGNSYVTTAKMLVNLGGTAIDMPAGPSELAIWADSATDPAFVAADLLAQAEHGHDSQVVLVTLDEHYASLVMQELSAQLAVLPRRAIIEKSLLNSHVLVFESEDGLVEFLNNYAPEHLVLAIKNAAERIPRIVNAGSVFIGPYSSESCGDYASGTNHTLPTSGFARAYSGVSLDSFYKYITFQEVTSEGLAVIGKAVEVMAEAEGLQAHKNAITVRLRSAGATKV